ncbi:unnamed protein product [Polarella glacialis]|uniref:Uncharacterized protein n=1 Tax=Polarella glacialis TaxID=89957 RepID=A0A813LA35_POLGL|nr:unnamed protein product [Polarella glacialis]
MAASKPGGSLGKYQGSIQNALDLGDMPETANEPGPGHYFGPESKGFSSLGKQHFSKCNSAPVISLPKTGWKQWEKIQISKGHLGASQGRQSPGALYEVQSSIDLKSGTKIGTSLRPDLCLSLGVDPKGSPGPIYNLRESQQGSIGEVAPWMADGSGQNKVRSWENCPRTNKAFGQGQRFKTDMRSANVGPGQYRMKDMAINIGNGRSIGTGRESWQKVITPGWEIEGQCRSSPGVGPPLWTDVTKSGGCGPMGRAERFPKARSTSCSPGPGTYTSGIKDTLISESPGIRGTFGNKPKKPRFRMMLIANIPGAKHGAWGYN